MLAKVQSKEDVASPERGTEYVPYSSSVVTKALLDYAGKHLNESAEARERGLRELRDFVKNEFDITVDSDDEIYLLCFLRSRKFDTKRAKTLMMKGVEFLEAHRHLLERVKSTAIRRSTESNVIGFLPYRDAKSRALVYVRAENWNPSVITTEEIIFSSMVTLQTAIDNPVNHIAGFVVVLDLKNLKLQHLVALSNWLLFGIQALQRCCPCLVKEIHVVNTPSFFRGVWKVTKPLLSEKLRRRINFYKPSNWESLHRKIPPEILPSELNGKLGPFSNNHWAGDISAIEKSYHQKIHRFWNRRTESS